MADVCSICCETRLTASRVAKCPFCAEACCRGCLQRYLLGSQDDPACMFCKNALSREHLEAMLPKSFLAKQYKEHRQQVLLQRETAMVPASMPYVEQEVQRRRNEKVLEQMREERARLKRKVQELDRACHDLERRVSPPLEARRQFVHRCGRANCMGWLSIAWKCSTCEHYTCPDCNADRGLDRSEEHVCDPEMKATMEAIRKDSKKCPGCGQFIQRVEGCAQMWCVECHTAWDYTTGLKINGNIHNPHFYEFQRRNGPIGRLHNDVPCGGFPHYRELSEITDPIRACRHRAELFSMHRLVLHIEDRELRAYPTETPPDVNLRLRVQWVLHDIDSEKLKRLLQQREKAAHKKRDIGLVLRMVVDASADRLREFVVSARDAPPADVERAICALVSLLTALMTYANDALKTVALRYGCVVPQLDLTRFRVYTISPPRARGSLRAT